MLPVAIAAAIPLLMKTADALFFKESPDAPSVGPIKKQFVMKALETAYDTLGVAKILPDFEGIDEKRLVLRTAEVWIEELAPALNKKPAA